MNVAALVASQILALALGVALVTSLVRRGPGALAVSLGYGFVLGSIGVTLVLRGLSVAGVKWSFGVAASAIIALAALIHAVGRRYRAQAPAVEGQNRDSRQGPLFWCLAALVAAHWGLTQYEAWVRPLFPWDASTHWSSKARVWYELREIAPFVDETTWVRAAGGVYTDAHPGYPGTVPLQQAWAAIAWGAWDDAVINVGWPLTLLALAAGIYGQSRRLGLSPAAGMAGAFAVSSLPFVGVHAALAGYADLTLGTLYAFAVLSLAVWVRERRAADAAVLAICALALPMIKAPGWAWLATLAVGAVSACLARRLLIGLAAAGALACVVLLFAAAHFGVPIMGYSIRAFSWNAVASLFDNLFIADSWHLLGIAAPLALLIARRELVAPDHLPVGLALSAGALFLAIVLFFSSTSDEGVTEAITVNRALLHWLPALSAYAVWMLDAAVRQRSANAALAPAVPDEPLRLADR